jgi:hypothetical protein
VSTFITVFRDLEEVLTPMYIGARIKALTNPRDDRSQKFIEIFAEQQGNKLLQWFEKEKML